MLGSGAGGAQARRGQRRGWACECGYGCGVAGDDEVERCAPRAREGTKGSDQGAGGEIKEAEVEGGGDAVGGLGAEVGGAGAPRRTRIERIA